MILSFILLALLSLVHINAAAPVDDSAADLALLENAALLEDETRRGVHRPPDTVIINVDVDEHSSQLTDIDTGYGPGYGGGRPGHGGYGPGHG